MTMIDDVGFTDLSDIYDGDKADRDYTDIASISVGRVSGWASWKHWHFVVGALGVWQVKELDVQGDWPAGVGIGLLDDYINSPNTERLADLITGIQEAIDKDVPVVATDAEGRLVLERVEQS